MSVYVEGSISYSKYTDKDEITRHSTDINASSPHGRIILLNSEIPKGFQRDEESH
jgi:single-stranded DNA-binding protein